MFAISKYNLKLSTFSDIFEQWQAGNMGVVTSLSLSKEIMSALVLVLNIEAQTYWF